MRRFTLPRPGYRHGAPKSSAIPTSLHPDIHFPAMIPRRGVKIKFFLSVVIYVVKAAFVPFSAIGEKSANACAARLCGISPYPVPDTATALPKQARYQLRYTRLLSFLSGWAYSPKASALPTALHPEIFSFAPTILAQLLTFLPACFARPACGPRKNPRAVRLLDFFDRGACSASLHPPPAALGFAPQSAGAANCAAPPKYLVLHQLSLHNC